MKKKGWFYDLEILGIYQQINWETRQQDPKTLRTKKQKPPN